MCSHRWQCARETVSLSSLCCIIWNHLYWFAAWSMKDSHKCLSKTRLQAPQLDCNVSQLSRLALAGSDELKTIYICSVVTIVVALAPAHKAGWRQVFTFRSYFRFSPESSKTLLIVIVLTIPISVLLGLYWPNYPNISHTTRSWLNQLILNDEQIYWVAQLEVDPYDSISHIYISILSTVTRFQCIWVLSCRHNWRYNARPIKLWFVYITEDTIIGSIEGWFEST